MTWSENDMFSSISLHNPTTAKPATVNFIHVQQQYFTIDNVGSLKSLHASKTVLKARNSSPVLSHVRNGSRGKVTKLGFMNWCAYVWIFSGSLQCGGKVLG